MIIKGIGASNGIAIGKVYKYEPVKIEIIKEKIKDPQKELSKLDHAISTSIKELEVIRDDTKKNIDEESAQIFDAHIEILNDPEFTGAIKTKVESELVNASYALDEVTKMFVNIFNNIDDEYIKERVADIKDVSKRLAYNILGIKRVNARDINEEVILIADDLTPSDTAQLNKQFIKAFVTNAGGRTSHSAIMARTLEIPAIVGTKTALKDIKIDDIIIADGFTGEVIINPTELEINKYLEKSKTYEQEKEIWIKLKNEQTLTKDKHHVDLAANIGSPEDIDGVIQNGAEGIGLFRTEFLYMGRNTLPTEEEQFTAYKKVLESMDEKPVIVRTLDVGGDKNLPYLKMDNEMNPFLGNRAIRLCLNNKDIFKTQLRALLRASIYGNLKIMFPMIATIDEFLEAKAELMIVKAELLDEGIEVDNIELGIMIEIPSAAILADKFAEEVDFFSIGTNDLIQYTFAADRMNEKVSYLYQPYNPSLLNLIKIVIDGAHKQGKWVGMCGEMAGEEMAVPILLGLGLDEFSMSASSILKARHIIKKLDSQEMINLSNTVIKMRSQKEVYDYTKDYLSKIN